MISKTVFFSALAVAATIASDLPSKRLTVGDSVPSVTVRTEEGKAVNLQKVVSEKPTVLIFYRGGWCPFCTRHLKELAGFQEELRNAGLQLIALSIDQPVKLRETPHREELSYRLLSDSDASAAKAFGIAFKVDDATVKKYKESYQIDLEAAAGRTHHLLPHPAVYVVDRSGKIHFAHVNEDYKKRLEPEKILAAAKDALKEK